VTCVALVLLFTTPGPHRKWWWILAGLGVVGMAWSRTYLQVHWLTDVIAGAFLGAAVSLLVFSVAQLQASRLVERALGRSAGSSESTRSKEPRGLTRSSPGADPP
jgi:membrane-associated phospholipid phosphatase